MPVTGDNMRPDPWAPLRDLDPFDIGDEKLYLTQGTYLAVNENQAYEICIMTEFVGEVKRARLTREKSPVQDGIIPALMLVAEDLKLR